MPDFIHEIPSTQLALYSALIAVADVAAGLLLVKPFMRIFFGTGPDFNQNLAFGASGFSLFYRLLLGLLTVSAYQNSEKDPTGGPGRGADHWPGSTPTWKPIRSPCVPTCAR